MLCLLSQVAYKAVSTISLTIAWITHLGTLRTDFPQNAAAKYALPPKSLYKSYLSNILGRIYLSQGTMDTDEFARSVAAKALPVQESYTMDDGDNTVLVRKQYGTPARYLSIGANAFTFWILGWLPRGMVLNLLWKRAQGFKPPPGVEVSVPQ